MKKKLAFIILALLSCTILSACNVIKNSAEWDKMIDKTITALTSPNANFTMNSDVEYAFDGTSSSGKGKVVCAGNKMMVQTTSTGQIAETNYSQDISYRYLDSAGGTLYSYDYDDASGQYIRYKGTATDDSLMPASNSFIIFLQSLKGKFGFFQYAHGQYSVPDTDLADFTSAMQDPQGSDASNNTRYSIKVKAGKLSKISMAGTDSDEVTNLSYTFTYGGAKVTLPTNYVDG